MSDRPVIALDVGGTKIAGGIVEGGARVRCREQVPTPTGEGPEAVLAAMFAMAGRLRAACPAAAAIGVGSAGMIDHRNGRVIFANENLPGWTGMPIGDRMHEALGLPVVVENDVNTMALAEAGVGAAAGRRVALVVAL